MTRKHRTRSDKPQSSSPGVTAKGDSGMGASRKPPRLGRWVLIGMFAAAVIAVLWIWPIEGATRVLPPTLVDLVMLGALLLTAAALGSAIIRLIGPADLPRPLALLTVTAIGIGAFAILTLVAGLAGVIGGGLAAAPAPAASGDIDQRLAQANTLAGPVNRWFFFLLPALAAGIGGLPLLRILRGRRGGESSSPDHERANQWSVASGQWPEKTGQAVSGYSSLDTRHSTLPRTSPWVVAAVVLVPVLIVLIAGANLPPGILWSGNLPEPLAGHEAAVDLEGYGYDALEYHLQVPREYLDNGKISFLPHNVYASFPLNAEMWFMFLMGLIGRPQSAVYLIHWLNVLMMAMTVGGVYLAARPSQWSVARGQGPEKAGQAATGRSSSDPRPPTPDTQSSLPAVFAAIAVAATPMLAAVSVVAYVEPMMLMFIATALALIRHYQLAAEPAAGHWPLATGRSSSDPRPPATDPRPPLPDHALVIGLLLGLAAGTKYLAIPLFILPLAAGLLVTGGLTRLPVRMKLSHVLLVGFGAAVAFAPWMIRTAVQSGGNPFFPLLWELFGGGNWTAADALRWKRAHLPSVSIGERLDKAWWRFFSHPSLTTLAGESAPVSSMSSSLYGAWLYLLAWPVFLTRQRSRWDVMLAVTFACQFAFWLMFTDQPGRFMLPAVPVLGLLVGRSIAAIPKSTRGIAIVALITLAMISGFQLVGRFQMDTQGRLPEAELKGQSPFYVAGMMFRNDFQETNPSASAGVLNRFLADHDAPHDKPVLWSAGEAKMFYVLYPAEYNVVFSHDPLVDQLAARPPSEVANWLTVQGYRYLFINWQEVARLRGYGLPEAISIEKLRGLGRVTRVTELGIKLPSILRVQALNEQFEPPWMIEVGVPAALPTTLPAALPESPRQSTTRPPSQSGSRATASGPGG